MKFLCTGWYGTETLGDRAILLGIIQLLGTIDQQIDFSLLSLHPFYSERIANEDIPLANKLFPKLKIDFSIYDAKSVRQTFKLVQTSDLVIMGGGPLMDLDELLMVETIFRIAKILNKPCFVFGCGIGPLRNPKYKKSVFNILQFSSYSVFRDCNSFQYAQSLGFRNIDYGLDPAFHFAYKYRQYLSHDNVIGIDDCISLNLREVSPEYASHGQHYYDKLLRIVDKIACFYPTHKITMQPMNYFHVGGDDRNIMHRILSDVASPNLYIQNNIVDLETLLDTFARSKACVGMRYHSVALQMAMNGCVSVIDYTDNLNGKTRSFLNDIGYLTSSRTTQYTSLSQDDCNISLDIDRVHPYIVDNLLINKSQESYVQALEKVLT